MPYPALNQTIFFPTNETTHQQQGTTNIHYYSSTSNEEKAVYTTFDIHLANKKSPHKERSATCNSKYYNDHHYCHRRHYYGRDSRHYHNDHHHDQHSDECWATKFGYSHLILTFLLGINLLLSFSSSQISCQKVNIFNDKSRDSSQSSSASFEQINIEPKFVINGLEVKTLSEYNNQLSNTTHLGVGLAPSQTSFCPNELTIKFVAFGHDFTIELKKNKQLIRNKHKDIGVKKNDVRLKPNHHFIDTNADDHCHYIENASLEEDKVLSAISIVDNGLLTGIIVTRHGCPNGQASEDHHHDEHYLLEADTQKSTTTLSRYLNSNECNNFPPSIQYQSTSKNTEIRNSSQNRVRRSISTRKLRRSTRLTQNTVKHGPFNSNSSSLFVDLLIVHDQSQFVKYKGNTTQMTERTMQIVNIMNAFYRQLNIFVALVGVVIWIDNDEITLTEDGDATLKEFLKYRYEKLLPLYHHDNAQLLTDTKFKDEVVGKAFRGPMCTYEHSGGVNKDHASSPAVVAVTLAHELGHNFGMEHDDETKCKCQDEKCIMAAKSSEVHPKYWSSCSVNYLIDARNHGLLDCLMDKPQKVLGPTCGNGFVEEGEDCDLGEPIPTYGTSRGRKNTQTSMSNGAKCPRGENCDSINPCCDKTTCKFVVNATCAQGPCCDLTTCSVFNGTESKICRPRRNECDLEEICDGKSEYCPNDVYYHDGIECYPGSTKSASQDSEIEKFSLRYNRTRAYCYKGKCASHESQCQLLWGPTGTASADICYEQNIHGNTSGNCGFKRRFKTYEACQPEDAVCGMLHCGHEQDGAEDRKHGKLAYGFESASILTMSYFISGNRAESQCFGAIIDAGPYVSDPGMVPNGASCGEDRMCIDQKCSPVYDVLYSEWCPSDCNGNGICDNLGVCHCNDGTIGTSCYQFFGFNFHLSLILYMVLFFIPMIALIVVTINYYKNEIKIWWFLHNRRIALKDKARLQQTKQNRRTLYSVDGNKVTISEPIPLTTNTNNCNNINANNNNNNNNSNNNLANGLTGNTTDHDF